MCMRLDCVVGLLRLVLELGRVYVRVLLLLLFEEGLDVFWGVVLVGLRLLLWVGG